MQTLPLGSWQQRAACKSNAPIQQSTRGAVGPPGPQCALKYDPVLSTCLPLPVPLLGVAWVVPAPSGLTYFNQLELVTLTQLTSLGLLRWPSGKESAGNAGASGDAGSIPGWGRSPGGGHGNPLPYSCLENLMDRGAWRVQSTGSQRVGHD